MKLIKLIKLMEKTSADYGNLAKRLDFQLKNSVEGLLTIRKDKGLYSFYMLSHKGENPGTYIPKTREDLKRKLSEKDYHLKLRDAALKAKKELDRSIERLKRIADPDLVYSNLPQPQRAYTKQIDEDTEYAQQWKSEPYARRSGGIYGSLGTEKSRSKSEALIINLLKIEGACYLYERPLVLEPGKVIHPDFTILNPRTRQVFYWEHLGMMDKTDYRETAMARIEEYARYGHFLGKDLIITMESNERPLNLEMIQLMIRNLFL